MDCVELVAALPAELQRVRLVELERIPRLGTIINAHNFEASAMVAHARAACTAEQIEQTFCHG
jgi:hypothetical protein